MKVEGEAEDKKRIETVTFGSCALLDDEVCIVVNEPLIPRDTVKCVKLHSGRSVSVDWGTRVAIVNAKVVIE